MQFGLQPEARIHARINPAVTFASESGSRRRREEGNEILDAVADAIIMVDVSDKIVFFNRAAETMFGYDADDVIGRSLRALLPDWRQSCRAMGHDAPGARTSGGNMVGYRRGGIHFDTEFSSAPARSNGEPVSILVLRDISERKRAEENARATVAALSGAADAHALLLNEFRHRMKNNFQVILSMINLEKASLLSAEAIAGLDSIGNRIIALNGVDGELLVAREDQPIALGSYVNNLADKLKGLFHHASIPVAFRLSLDEIYVPATTAAHLGLLINEAVTNSFKYAVPRGATEIGLTLARHGENILLTVSDNGPGPDGAETGHVGGTKLMRTLAARLGATFERDRQQAGMLYRIEFPAMC